MIESGSKTRSDTFGSRLLWTHSFLFNGPREFPLPFTLLARQRARAFSTTRRQQPLELCCFLCGPTFELRPRRQQIGNSLRRQSPLHGPHSLRTLYRPYSALFVGSGHCLAERTCCQLHLPFEIQNLTVRVCHIYFNSFPHCPGSSD